MITPRHTAELIAQAWPEAPSVGVILGTGLGAFVEAIQIEHSFSYDELPGFCTTTAIGHAGELVCGKLDGTPVVALRGRSHCYEGVSREEITFPVRVLRELGVQTLVVSCAAGGLNPLFRVGEIMLITDQIDFLYPRLTSLDPSRQVQKQPLFHDLLCSRLEEVAKQENISLRQGTYVSVTGPNYETRAEMRFYRMLADAIGMSTVPEVLQANKLGMQVVGLATITNLCNPDALVGADGDHVVCVASEAEPAFRKLVCRLIQCSADLSR